MKYQHTFTVDAALADVVRFHCQSASMGAITPPPVIVQIHRAPERLGEGDEMDFTLWLGPLPLRWLARIENVTDTGFVDRMIQGPFSSWVHRHSFIALDAQTTTIQDQVEAILHKHWFWRIVGRLMWLNLPFLFAFRAFKTRRLLMKD